MATLCKSYSSEIPARDALDALTGAGVPSRDIRLLTRRQLCDVCQEPVGGFAGTTGPDAPIGSFANRRHSRRQPHGNFASVDEQQREGSFADAVRDVIVSYENGAERSRVVGAGELRRLLRAAGLEDAARHRVINELHLGHAVVLAQLEETASSEARETEARLEQVAHAA